MRRRSPVEFLAIFSNCAIVAPLGMPTRLLSPLRPGFFPSAKFSFIRLNLKLSTLPGTITPRGADSLLTSKSSAHHTPSSPSDSAYNGNTYSSTPVASILL